MKKIFTDRSRSQAKLRCARQRWHEYHSGPAQRGIVPKRKNLHLIVGLGFHAGVEVLLKRAMAGADMTDETVRLDAENNAVQAALLELEKHFLGGVEVDLQEQVEIKPGADLGKVKDANVGQSWADSPIVIDFSAPIYSDDSEGKKT